MWGGDCRSHSTESRLLACLGILSVSGFRNGEGVGAVWTDLVANLARRRCLSDVPPVQGHCRSGRIRCDTRDARAPHRCEQRNSSDERRSDFDDSDHTLHISFLRQLIINGQKRPYSKTRNAPVLVYKTHFAFGN